MKSWIDNLQQYEKNKNTGICPKCGSSDICVEELHYGRKSISFKCNACGSGDHFDFNFEEKSN